MSRRSESSLAEGIGGLVLFGIFLVIESWKIICIVIICVVVLVVVIAVVANEVQEKREEKEYLNTYNKNQYNQNITEQIPEQKPQKTRTRKQQNKTVYEEETENIFLSDNNQAETNTYSPKNKIDIKKCSYDDMMSLGILNKATVSRFIKERDNGSIWYNIDSFAVHFNLQPHEIVQIRDWLIFPKEPIKRIKTGRKVEW